MLFDKFVFEGKEIIKYNWISYDICLHSPYLNALETLITEFYIKTFLWGFISVAFDYTRWISRVEYFN